MSLLYRNYAKYEYSCDDPVCINIKNVRWMLKDDDIEKGGKVYSLIVEFKSSGVRRLLTYENELQRNEMYDEIARMSNLA